MDVKALPRDRWYVVKVKPNNESRASIELRRLGLRVYVPKRIFRPSNRRQTNPKPRRRPLLVGYILVRFPSHLHDSRRQPQFGIVVDCQSIASGQPYLCWTDKRGERAPMPLSGDDVMELMQRQRHHAFNEIRIAEGERTHLLEAMRAAMKAGQSVLIIDGPFLGFDGQLVSINDDGSAEVTVELIGHQTTLVVEDAARGLTTLAKIREAA